MKTCPVCGKKVAAQAQYCIYCSAKFDDVPKGMTFEDTDVSSSESVPSSSGRHHKGLFGLLVTVASLLVIAVVVVLVIIHPPSSGDEQTDTTTTAPVTTATRNAAHDEWMQTFLGQWVDEGSTGKKSLEKQGGYILHVHEVFHDYVTFDLLSYQGGEDGATAYISEIRSTVYDDTLHFTFKDDGLKHSGEGFIRFKEHEIEMEVLIDGEDTLPEDEHSLAVCSVFKRRQLPESVGHDLKGFTTLDSIKEVSGKQTKDAVKDKKGNTTYYYGSLQVVADADGQISSVTVDYASLDDKTQYAFDGIDGTMTYDTVKAYFGEALHDYVEQPTDIRVLHYETDEKASVTFTFDADDNLLIRILYDL